MDDCGFDHVLVWLERRVELPVGPLFCVIDESTRGRAWSATAVRAELRRLAADAGFVVGSRRTSCVTRMRLSLRGKGCW